MDTRLEIVVVRADGRSAPLACEEVDMVAVCRRALELARTLAQQPCPLGDAPPPRCVDVLEDGALLLSVAIAPMARLDDAPAAQSLAQPAAAGTSAARNAPAERR